MQIKYSDLSQDLFAGLLAAVLGKVHHSPLYIGIVKKKIPLESALHRASSEKILGKDFKKQMKENKSLTLKLSQKKK